MRRLLSIRTSVLHTFTVASFVYLGLGAFVSLARSQPAGSGEWVVFLSKSSRNGQNGLANVGRTRPRVGDEVRTNASSEADILLRDAALLRIREHSSVVFDKLASAPERFDAITRVQFGHVLVKTDPSKFKGSKLLLKTPQGSFMMEPGSSLFIQVDPSAATKISVIEGQVTVGTSTIRSGQQAELKVTSVDPLISEIPETEKNQWMRWSNSIDLVHSAQAALEVPEVAARPLMNTSNNAPGNDDINDSPGSRSAPDPESEGESDEKHHPGEQGESYPKNEVNLSH